MAQSSKAVDVLQDLVETNRDAQSGYRDAAQHVTDVTLKSFFNEQSLERARFAGELEQELQRLGEHNPDRTGSISGTLHRKWLDLKASLGGGDHTILSSVEQGEDTAKKAYEEAISTSAMPEDIVSVLRLQFSSVKSAHDRVKALRDGVKAA